MIVHYLKTTRNILKTSFNYYISQEYRYNFKEMELIIISLKKGYQLRSGIYYFK
jgi:hypothetical protein